MIGSDCDPSGFVEVVSALQPVRLSETISSAIEIALFPMA
jgi:hypothetical protein